LSLERVFPHSKCMELAMSTRKKRGKLGTINRDDQKKKHRKRREKKTKLMKSGKKLRMDKKK
jgi:hypothetical protein